MTVCQWTLAVGAGRHQPCRRPPPHRSGPRAREAPDGTTADSVALLCAGHRHHSINAGDLLRPASYFAAEHSLTISGETRRFSRISQHLPWPDDAASRLLARGLPGFQVTICPSSPETSMSASHDCRSSCSPWRPAIPCVWPIWLRSPACPKTPVRPRSTRSPASAFCRAKPTAGSSDARFAARSGSAPERCGHLTKSCP